MLGRSRESSLRAFLDSPDASEVKATTLACQSSVTIAIASLICSRNKSAVFLMLDVSFSLTVNS
jgi:hypothetical protein